MDITFELGEMLRGELVSKCLIETTMCALVILLSDKGTVVLCGSWRSTLYHKVFRRVIV